MGYDLTEEERIGYSQGVSVGLLDTGVTVTNAFNNVKINFRGDFLPFEGLKDRDVNGNVTGDDFVEPYGHGTMSADLITGAHGVAALSELKHYKVYNGQGDNSFFGVIDAVVQAVKDQNNILICNWGNAYEMPEVAEVVRWAKLRGVIFIAAAHNQLIERQEDTNPRYPARLAKTYRQVISVSALGIDRTPLAGTNLPGDAWPGAVLTPGQLMLTTSNKNEYAYYGGTSAAAPFTAGLMALVYGKARKLYPTASKYELSDHVSQVFLDSCTAYPYMTKEQQGRGVPNLRRALDSL